MRSIILPDFVSGDCKSAHFGSLPGEEVEEWSLEYETHISSLKLSGCIKD